MGKLQTMIEQKIIYDLGANNGDDVPYYLLKANKVIAVEANPCLADLMQNRFAGPIAAGRLFIENCVLTVDHADEAVAFYIHKHNHVLSQFPRPHETQLAQFEQVYLPSRNIVEIIRQHGEPYYVKVDVEHYDQFVLRSLFVNKIVPPYLSAEAHSIDVFSLMVALGGYEAFKLVDGSSISTRYKDAWIQTAFGEQIYSFPEHSAGPFGEDIAGTWMTKDNFFRLLGFAGLGWKDVHASRIDQADPAHAPRVRIQVDF
jgi:FkbM family methyltransferase